MARLGPQKPRVMTKVFRHNGLEECKVGRKTQGKGSHCVMGHPRDPNKKTAIPDYAEIDPGLAARIIKDAGKSISEYLSHIG